MPIHIDMVEFKRITKGKNNDRINEYLSPMSARRKHTH